MNIGGFQKNSLIDFPKTLACVVFTRGCNFKCPYCHNPELVAGPVKGSGSRARNRIHEKEVFSFLERRKGLLQGVVITGGEPTLQPDLAPFLSRVRELGYRIKLDSNGTRPQVLASLLERGLVDYIAMDIKTSLGNYSRIIKEKYTGQNLGTALGESIRLIMDRSPGYEFRTTCVKPFITKEIMAEIAGMIGGAKKYVLQNCSKNVLALDPDFLRDETRFFSSKQIRDLGGILSNAVESLEFR